MTDWVQATNIDIFNLQGIKKGNHDGFEGVCEHLIIAYMLFWSERDLAKDLWSNSNKTEANRLAKRSWNDLCLNLKNVNEKDGIKIVQAINKYCRQPGILITFRG